MTQRLLSLLVLLWMRSALSLSLLVPAAPQNQRNPKFVILGGTGKIGTAVATHLFRKCPDCQVVLVGRRGGEAAVQAVQKEVGTVHVNVSFYQVDDIWHGPSLTPLLHDATGVLHTAGPYADQSPTVLDAVLAAKVPVYVDVSDPLPFLQDSLQRTTSTTTALCAAGAFPGMSNVLAMEAASQAEGTQNVRFHYFTKGLGGSGTVNLYITNLGFGDVMTQHDQGTQRAFTRLSGKLLGHVDFFVNENSKDNPGNELARKRVGRQQVFAWPFPEAATVALELSITGSSSAAMGTAPDFWNVMLGLLVQVVPRRWWRSKAFSKFMADFSQPLVVFTDAWLQRISSSGGGETHAMRIDLTPTTSNHIISIVQAHESFRQCVGQSCAEFALDLWEHPSPGVYLPEQRYRDDDARKRIIDKLTSTPGTFCYTGPVKVSPSTNFPTNIDRVVKQAKQEELQYNQ